MWWPSALSRRETEARAEAVTEGTADASHPQAGAAAGGT
jgi:hypothetical protein